MVIQSFSHQIMIIWLVVSTYPSEKYEFVSWENSSQLNGKMIQMFQATNQNWISLYIYGVCIYIYIVGYDPMILG